MWEIAKLVLMQTLFQWWEASFQASKWIFHLHFQKFTLCTDTGIHWKTDKEPTEEETLKETLGKGDHSVCTWRLALYREGREFWSHSSLDFKQKCSEDLVQEWYVLMAKVSRKRHGARKVGKARKWNIKWNEGNGNEWTKWILLSNYEWNKNE